MGSFKDAACVNPSVAYICWRHLGSRTGGRHPRGEAGVDRVVDRVASGTVSSCRFRVCHERLEQRESLGGWYQVLEFEGRPAQDLYHRENLHQWCLYQRRMVLWGILLLLQQRNPASKGLVLG